MGSNIEHRVGVLEEEVTELKKKLQRTKIEKDWRKTFGMSADDPGFDEMIQLGQEIRDEGRQDDR